MPVHDAPLWRMDRKALAAVEEVAPAQRVFLRQLMDTLETVDGVAFNDRFSFAAEVLAAQVNLLAVMVRERRKELSPRRQFSHADLINVVVSDIMNRAQL